MKLFKTIAAVALLVLSTSIMAQGQGNRRSSSERAKTETENIVKALALTPEQAAKVLEINLKYATKDSIRFAEMRASGATPDMDAMRTARTAQREEQAKEVKAVITDDQKTKYDAYLKEREAQRGAPRQGGQGGGQGGQRPN